MFTKVVIVLDEFLHILFTFYFLILSQASILVENVTSTSVSLNKMGVINKIQQCEHFVDQHILAGQMNTV